MSAITNPYVKAKTQHTHVCPGCGKTFVGHENRKYHNRACQKAHWQRENPPTYISAERVRKEEGLKSHAETPKRHVCTDKCVRIDYGDGKPVCFKAYFQERREHRKGVMVTDERTRERTRNNARRAQS